MTKRKISVINHVKEALYDRPDKSPFQLVSIKTNSSLATPRLLTGYWLSLKEILLSKANQMKQRKNFGGLTSNKLKNAEFFIVKNVQEPSLKLKRPNPFMLNRVIHIGRRLEWWSLDFEQKQPIKLPPNHRLQSYWSSIIIVGMDMLICKGATRKAAKGAETPPLAKSKLRKKIKTFNF